MKKIEDKVVNTYKTVEDTVVSGYKKIENTVVSGYTNIEDKFVDKFLKNDGETTKEAKERLRNNKKLPD